MASWHVYILRCADGSLYTGVTTDVFKRLAKHDAGTGAKYTRGRGPVCLLWKKRCKTKGAALKLEASIKALDRKAKLRLIRPS
jgi:putative endonuclease